MNIIIIQSDSTSGFISTNLISLIYKVNTFNKENNLLVISRQKFTEAQTGKNKLDTHFSYLNIKLKSYVEDEHAITIEEDVVKGISSSDDVQGTTVILVDTSMICTQKYINKYLLALRLKLDQLMTICGVRKT